MDFSNITGAFGLRNVSPATVPAETATEAVPSEPQVPSVTVSTRQTSPLNDIGETDAVTDSALRRDDPLGKLVAQAFQMPAPPPPTFE